MSEHPMVLCENLVKIYKTDEIEVVALQGLDLVVQPGELMAIIGNSGSGKSTLLNMIGGLDKPSAGRLLVGGKDLVKMTPKDMMTYVRQTVGFVWQNNARNLIPYLTARENVELPMTLNGKRDPQRALELLEMVDIAKRRDSKLGEMSGGEQQRVAIAIALANNPKLLLADEPTGAVDTKTSSHIVDVFRTLKETLGLTIVIVTHDRSLSQKVDRVVAIRDGRTSSEILRKSSYREQLEHMEDLASATIEETHEELAVLDRAGRLQIPREYLEAIEATNGKLRVEFDAQKKTITLTAPGSAG